MTAILTSVFTGLFNALAGFIGAIFGKRADILAGQNSQALKDAEAANAAARQAQKTRSDVAALDDAALDRELRRPGSPGDRL